MFKEGPETRYLQMAPCFRIILRYNRIYPWGDAAEGVVWLQHPPSRGGLSADVWVEAQALINCGGPPGAALTAPHP